MELKDISNKNFKLDCPFCGDPLLKEFSMFCSYCGSRVKLIDF